MVFLHEHPSVKLFGSDFAAFGRQAAWRSGDAKQALCLNLAKLSLRMTLIATILVTWSTRSCALRSTYDVRGPLSFACRHYKTCCMQTFLFPVVARSSRHVVVAPILAAPLLTDTRRSTVGPGTHEDIMSGRVQRRGGVHRASSCGGICSSGGVHRTVSCSDRSTCASDGAHLTTSVSVVEHIAPVFAVFAALRW